MQRLNAIDAISPAFTRTHALLFQPFRWGRTWKLCATAYLAFAGSLFVPVPLLLVLIPWHRLPPLPALRATIVLATLAYTLVIFAFFYLGSRLEMVEFEAVLTGQKLIAPMWRRYGVRVWPWLTLKAAIGTLVTLVFLPVFSHVIRSVTAGVEQLIQANAVLTQAPNSQIAPELIFGFFGQIFDAYALLIAFFLTLKLASTLLADFVLPFYLLEPIPLSAAVRRGLAILRDHPLSVLGYVCMKYLLAFLGLIAQSVMNQVVLIPFMLIFGIGAAALGIFSQTSAHTGVTGGAIAGIVLGYLFFLILIFYLQIGTLGYLFLLLQSYSQYFLGGLYPALGDRLSPPAPPYMPPPPPPRPIQLPHSPHF